MSNASAKVKHAALRARAEQTATERYDNERDDVDQMAPQEVVALVHELRVHQIELEMQNDELRRAYAQVEASGARYSDLYESAPVGYATIDRAGTTIKANRTLAILLGTKPDELVEAKLSQFVARADQDAYYQWRRELFDDPIDEAGLEIRLVRTDGSTFSGQLTARLSRMDTDRDGAPLALVVIHDVSRRKAADRAMFLLEQLDAVGLLAAGIAHDFNGIFTALTLLLSMLGERVSDDPTSSELVIEAEQSCESATALAAQLLTFSRGGKPVMAAEDLRGLVTSAAMFATRGSAVRCSFDLGTTPLMANVERRQLTVAILNVMANAIEATSSRGRVSIGAGLKDIGEDDTVGAQAGRYVELTIHDDGPGIEPGHIDKIFEPYFTTTKDRNGLGLSIARSILTRHDGSLRASSEPGAGARFHLLLPVFGEVPARVDNAPATAAGTHACILIMDDDPWIRRAATRALERLGHKVTCVTDGSQAVACWQQAMGEGHPFDLGLFDLTVPEGLGGAAALAALREIDPTARVIASSGYSDDNTMAHCAELGFCAVLPKPYRPEQLNEVITQVLASARTNR